MRVYYSAELPEKVIRKDELTAKIADEELKKPSFNEDFIRFWLMKFGKFDISQKKQRKALIEIFVNAIFLYDDRMWITFNYKDGTQTVRFEDTLTADCAEKFFPASFLQADFFVGNVEYRSGNYAFSLTKSAQTC